MRSFVCVLFIVLSVLLCSCAEINADESNTVNSVPLSDDNSCGAEQWPDYLLDFTEYWTADDIPGYSYPEVNPDLEPEYIIEVRDEFSSGCETVKFYLIELNGKQYCYYDDVYILEKKNSEGQWVFVAFEKEHVLHFQSAFNGNTDGEKTNPRTLTIRAKNHGLDGFEAGEYRVTKTAVCLVNGEERQSIVTGEFTIK